MLTRTDLYERHRFTDEALTRAYTSLFGLPLALAGEDTPQRQLVRRRAWEEAGPYLKGEMTVGKADATPLPGVGVALFARDTMSEGQ